jgi:hypothetical protein
VRLLCSEMNTSVYSFADFLRSLMTFECDCLFHPPSNNTRQQMDDYCVAYNQRQWALAEQYRQAQYPEFAGASEFDSA